MREGVSGAAAHPPRPTLTLSVGVTGHRALSVDDAARFQVRVDALLRDISARVAAIAATHADVFDPCPPGLALLSPLAQGADQIAAEVALEQGWQLRATLPFARDDYARDFDADGVARLDALLARAQAVWTVPADASDVADRTRGYELAGDATVAHADLLVAAWDGERARGNGGTAQVVEHAIRRGVPVIHLPVGGTDAPAILWTGFDDLQVPMRYHAHAPRRALDVAALVLVVDTLLLPPDPRPLTLFLGERERRLRTRPEWLLLLALTRVQGVRRASFRARGYHEAARSDWAAYHAGAGDICGPAAKVELLEQAFGWADGLALHYAHVYRSGMVLNFGGAALAVLLSLASGLFPASKLTLLVLELTVILAVIVNTGAGTRREWHRRWLDYRFLAEQLRPLKSLALLGAASPPFKSRLAERRWTDWYALAFWRAMGLPPPLPDGTAVRAAARHVAAHELEGQVAYHGAAAHRMHVLDHRLHRLGLILLIATIAAGSTMLVGVLGDVPAIERWVPVLAVMSAALPTLGAAIFGIRGAGDFAATAGRSAETARRLGHAAALLRRDDLAFATAACTVEEAAAIMLADLADWRTSYAYRKLAIPS